MFINFKQIVLALVLSVFVLVFIVGRDMAKQGGLDSLNVSKTVEETVDQVETPTLAINFGNNTSPTPLSVNTDQDDENRYLVTRVIDGDTIEIDTGQTIRYIGINTPETSHPYKGVECFGKEATERNRELVENQFITLEKDVSETDKYGRLLRYVYLDGMLVNERLVTEGYAYASTYPPDVKYQERFARAQYQAEIQAIGLWADGACNDFQDAAVTEFPTVPSPTGSCLIKGNISYETKKHIYHTPDCPYYDKTKINEAKGEMYFCNEQEAIDAGWQKAENCP